MVLPWTRNLGTLNLGGTAKPIVVSGACPVSATPWALALIRSSTSTFDRSMARTASIRHLNIRKSSFMSIVHSNSQSLPKTWTYLLI